MISVGWVLVWHGDVDDGIDHGTGYDAQRDQPPQALRPQW